MRLRWVGVWFACAVLVLVILFTLSLMFEQTGYGLTRLRDLGGHLA